MVSEGIDLRVAGVALRRTDQRDFVILAELHRAAVQTLDGYERSRGKSDERFVMREGAEARGRRSGRKARSKRRLGGRASCVYTVEEFPRGWRG